MIPVTLPLPKSAQRQQSEHCLQYLIHRYALHAGGSLSFAQYMHEVLYAPKWGYYTGNNAIFGRKGDFSTASVTGTFLAHALAHTFAPLLKHLGPKSTLVELGPGNGQLADDLLQCLHPYQQVLPPYFLIELSPSLQKIQRHLLKKSPWCTHYRWKPNIPKQSTSILFANELLDAMPYERLQWDGNQWLQSRIYYTPLRGLYETFVPFADPTVQALFAETFIAKQSCLLKVGFITEFCPQHASLITDLSARLEKGYVFLFDYGSYAQEHYRLDRDQGTLRCYYQHLVHEDCFVYPGIQDITADVDFSLIASLARAKGFTIEGFCTQAAFLLASGLLETREFSVQERQALQLLLQPSEMGERVKVLVLSKNVEPCMLPCFMLQDWSWRL